MKITTLLLPLVLGWPFSAYPINFSTYNFPSDFNFNWDGLGRDWNGNVYFGNGNGHGGTATGDAALYKFDFSTNQFQKLMDCRTVSQAAGNWLANDNPGKIHSSVIQGKDGKLYFSTHCGLEGSGPTGNDLVDYPAVFRGGHFYRYDPQAGTGEDLSAPNSTDHEGIFDVALGPWDPARGDYQYIYGGNCYPFGHVYRLDMVTKVHSVIFNTGAMSGNISRKIFDDNFGRVYIPWPGGVLAMYDPAQDTLRRGAFVFDGKTYIGAVTKSMSGDSIYIVGCASDVSSKVTAIYRVIVSQQKLEKIVDYDTTSGSGDWRANLHLRWDQNTLYFSNRGKLFSYNLDTRVKSTVATNLPSGLYGSEGVDNNGDLWFTDWANRRAVRVYLNAPCAVCSQKFPRFDLTASRHENARVSNPGVLELQISPNPARFPSPVRFALPSLPAGQRASLAVYSLQGRRVAYWPLAPEQSRSVSWSGSDGRGNRLPAGLYLVKLRAGKSETVNTLLLM